MLFRFCRFCLFCVPFAVMIFVTPCDAHTREKNRIDALEARLKKENSFVVQRLTTLDETLSRHSQAIDERVEHTRRIEKRMTLVEENIEKGLKAIRDTLGKEIDTRIRSLQAESSTQAAEISSLKKALESHRQSIEAINEALSGFKKYMAQSAKENNDSFSVLTTSQAAMKDIADKRYTQVVSRIDSLLKIVDEENRKLRRAISGTGGSSSGSRNHVVVSGDNVWSIARKYDVSRDELLQANPSLKDDDAVIHPGMTIVIP